MRQSITQKEQHERRAMMKRAGRAVLLFVVLFPGSLVLLLAAGSEVIK